MDLVYEIDADTSNEVDDNPVTIYIKKECLSDDECENIEEPMESRKESFQIIKNKNDCSNIEVILKQEENSIDENSECENGIIVDDGNVPDSKNCKKNMRIKLRTKRIPSSKKKASQNGLGKKKEDGKKRGGPNKDSQEGTQMKSTKTDGDTPKNKRKRKVLNKDTDEGQTKEKKKFVPPNKIEGPHICECGKLFPYRNYLTRHIRTMHSMDKKFVCEFCGKGFIATAMLERHKRCHSNERPYICDLCSASFRQPSALKSHLVTHGDIKAHDCTICDKKFSLKSTLQAHIRTVHCKLRPYICEVCGFAFQKMSALKKHLRTHISPDNKDRPFKCSVCLKSYMDSDTLTRHMRIHSGERNYHCGDCGKSFYMSSHLKSHVRIHSGEKPYVCTFCNKAFTQLSNMKSHRKTHDVPCIQGVDNEGANQEVLCNKNVVIPQSNEEMLDESNIENQDHFSQQELNESKSCDSYLDSQDNLNEEDLNASDIKSQYQFNQPELYEPHLSPDSNVDGQDNFKQQALKISKGDSNVEKEAHYNEEDLACNATLEDGLHQEIVECTVGSLEVVISYIDHDVGDTTDNTINTVL